MIVPHDLDAERSVVGGCITFSDSIPELIAALDPADFYDQAMSKLWAIIAELHRGGSNVDHVTISDGFQRRGWAFDPVDVVELRANGLRPRSEHVEIILRHSVARRLMALTGSIRDEVGNGEDPYEMAERLTADLATVDTPSLTNAAEARTLDDIVATADDLSPYVVPGLLRRDWRAVIVAGEGSGKSTLLRQIGACSAQGVHPLNFTRFDPIQVLLIDLENPAQAIAETGGRIVQQLRLAVGDAYDPKRFRVHMRPAGVDIRGRHDRAEIERAIRAQRPDLVILGPVYKLAARRDRENHEDVADATHRILDDLRTRYGFALVVEQHAGHGTAGVREMRPYGGSQWLRWPELGIGLKANGDHTGLTLTRWRGDRLHNEWPDEIRRNNVWPWVGIWNQPNGAF